MIGPIATGEIEDKKPGKDPGAVSMGARGGAARAQSLTAKKLTEIAKKAAAKRWEE